jgi:TonB-dependent starch-binding outer membrane protein SusC
VNLGEVENRGIDFEISSVNVDRSGFKWVTTFNIGLQENEIISLGPGVDRIGNTYIVGKPLGMLYTRTWAGVNPADGRPMYYDRNGNITYNPTTDDQKYQGSTIPTHYGGFINSFNYKGLSLEVFFQYQYGNESLIQAGQYLESYGIGDQNYATSQMRRWTTPGQITDTPKPDVNGTEQGGYTAQNLTSKYIQTASYVRLKQVTLAYQLPSALVSKAKLQGANVFVQGLNLATFTNFRGDDPENAIGNNLNQYPNPKQITAGITLEF